MSVKDTEIEIKVKIENVEPLISFLKKNAKFKSEERQIDEYFTPYHRDFLSVRPAKEWLRLRNENGKYIINYKNWYPANDGKPVHCDEFQTPIKDIDQMRKLFTALDFKPLVKVDKTRKKWDYKDYEISVDTVTGLGTFVEIEFKGKSNNPKKVTNEMIEFLKDMGVGKIQGNYQGYPFLLLFPDEAKYYDE
jgi:adenylate cyclase class 2